MPVPRPSSRPWLALRGLIESEAAGGLVLMASAALALLVANSSLAAAYFRLLKADVGGLSVLHWVNEGLMALFFVLVGLEIKRELIVGRLRTWPDRLLPGLAAAGGMVVPALVFVAINGSSPAFLRGWAIPTATDIAFALGIIALFGSRVPISLKVFVTALAIIDDLGAILIIAIFYTADLSWPMLGVSTVLFAALCILNRAGVTRLLPYLVLGVALWFFILQSGMHATVAGVLLAITIPLQRRVSRQGDAASPLHRLEHGLQPWTAFLVLPIFGFANAGVSLGGVTGPLLLDPITLGVALGLLVGKQVGIFGVVVLAIRLGLAKRPSHASWAQIYGVALLCGIGFTMSLFIGLLAFGDAPDLEVKTKIGVLIGSILCIAAGALVLGFSKKRLTSP